MKADQESLQLEVEQLHQKTGPLCRLAKGDRPVLLTLSGLKCQQVYSGCLPDWLLGRGIADV
jgi:hypothetical protein